MSFVTENNFQTPMFIPIPDNPLHLANSLKNPLFLLSRTPSPRPASSSVSTSFSTLQKKSSLKDEIPISNDVKHTVRWSSPISMSRVIPFRESDTVAKTAIPTQTTCISIPWSISQSLAPNEDSQCESITLFELDSHSFPREKKGSCSVLSFSRPRALLTQSEELQGRMNLMHLHKVIQPKILSLSISMHNTNSFTRQNSPSKALTNAKTSQHYVFGSAKSINIPKYPRSNDSRLKRRSTTPDRNCPRKIRKTDGFPSLKHVGSLLDRIMDQPSSSAGHPSSAELNSSGVDDDNSSGDDDELSDNESLFGDQELVRGVAVDVSTRRNYVSQSRHPLNSIKVFNWTNGLKRFDYLLQNKKMNWRCDDELYELLKGIDLEKDNITIELLKKTHVGKVIRGLIKCDEFEERSRFLAKRIYRSWLKMCREVEQ